MRPEVNDTKRITGKLKGLKLMRNLCVCRDDEGEEGQEMRSSHFSFLLENVRCLVTKENRRFVEGVIETVRVAFTLTREVEVNQWTKKGKPKL